MGSVTLQVVTPGKTVMNGEFDTVILRTADGDIGILPGHERYVCTLSVGTLRCIKGRDRIELGVLGGYLSVADDHIHVISPFADFPEKFDERVAEIIAERQENRLREEQEDLKTHRTETALRRALVHMDVSTYALIKGRFSKEAIHTDDVK